MTTNRTHAETVKREPGLDAVRAFAAFFVVLIHVSCGLFYSFSESWNVCVLYESMSRMSVALFSMLTGYLLLTGTDQSPGVFLYRRLSKLTIPLVVVLFVYYLKSDDTLYCFFIRILKNEVDFHFWYIYVLIGIYIVIPFLGKASLQDKNKENIKYFLFIWMAASIVYPATLAFTGRQNNPFGIFNFFCFVGYTIFGGILREITIPSGRRWYFLLLYCMSTILIFFFTKFYSEWIGKPSELFFEHFSPFVFLQAIAFFVYFKDLQLKNKIVIYVSKLSYWIYLIHILVLNVVQNYSPLTVESYPLISIPFITITVFFISTVISIPLHKLETALNAKKIPNKKLFFERF